MIDVIIEMIRNITFNFGEIGVLIGMFLGSSIIPVPSEAILVAAGALGLSTITVAIFGGVGSALGAVVGYYIGKIGGRPFLEKYGKYFFIDPKKLKFIDKWFKRWGIYAVLIGRIIPLIPHKVFSIGSGFGNMDFKKFFVFTLVGSIPRCFLLSYFGFLLSETRNIPLIIITLAIFFAIPVLIDRINSRRKKPEE